MGGSVPGGKAGFSSDSKDASLIFDMDLDCDEMRGRRVIQLGPASLSLVYVSESVRVLIRLPRVNTAIEDPCTKIEDRTRKVVTGQMR